jgi:hypothetical protein
VKVAGDAPDAHTLVEEAVHGRVVLLDQGGQPARL